MGLQARLTKDDQRLYNPGRDLAHCFDQVIMEVAERVEGETWPALTELAANNGLSPEDLGRACQCLCRFVAAPPCPGESMAGGLAQCGFLELHPSARVVVMAYMGTVVLGMNWAGVREATLGGVGPAQTYGRLRWHGMRCAKLMAMPRWRRALYKFRARCRRAWRAFRGNDYGE
jgi:hypothetical protein